MADLVGESGVTPEPTGGDEKRPLCSHCPPTCKAGCWPPDCECYRHQDWPDVRGDVMRTARLLLCIDGPGCDGRSHGLDCNEHAFRPRVSCTCHVRIGGGTHHPNCQVSLSTRPKETGEGGA